MFLLCKVCSSIGNSDPCRQLRHLVTEVVGTEESVAGRVGIFDMTDSRAVIGQLLPV